MKEKHKKPASSKVFATIDAGGTTFKCALVDATQAVLASLRVPTSSPSETLGACLRFFTSLEETGVKANAMGIASFGPIDVDPASQSYGTILDGPKSVWAGTNLKSYFEAHLSVPVGIDTDVNGALLAEMEWGAAKGVNSAAYVTIGTGIGAGLFANGGLIGKPSHPEFGHIRVKRHKADDDFLGVCPIHGDCLEGVASATALTERFGDPKDLNFNHIGWEIEAYYLAQACNALSLTFRPDKIVLGGGIMLAPHLLDMVREQYTTLINSYLGQSVSDIETLIVRPGLGDDAGLMGGVCLAKGAVKT